MAAMKRPLFPVSGQEPVPCHPPVPSLPEDQSLGSSEPTQKETGGVFPMRVLPGSMLGKSYRAGSIAASVVRYVGPCSVPGHKPRPTAGRWAVPKISKISRGRGSTVELLLPEHYCCYGSKPGCLWGSFWLFSTYKKQAGSNKYFLVKKYGHMGVYSCGS